MELIAPSSTFSETVPSGKIFPLNTNNVLIVVCIIINESPEESTATPFSFFAIPNATAIANIKGKLANTASPTLFITVRT